MQITVTLDDDFIEGEYLNDAIISTIKSSVSAQVMGFVKDQINEEVTEVIRAEITQTLQATIQQLNTEFIESGKLTIGGQEITVQDYFKRIFESNTHWNSPGATMEKLAKRWADELQKRYDGAFVSQMVKKINEAGFLKPEVASLILEPSKS